MQTKLVIIAVGLSAVFSSVLTAGIVNFGKLPETPRMDTKALSSQLAQLRRDLAAEVSAREALQQDLASVQTTQPKALISPPSPIENTAEASIAIDQEQATQGQQRRAEIDRIRAQRRAERLASQQPGYRAQQLVSAGFAQEEAARIVQIESQESLRQLQQQYKLRRARAERSDNSLAQQNPLRAELGDENYERYLDANGWPTAARIGPVIGGSPGESAGLQTGDQITSYAGERVFNLNEVTNLTVQGTVGESVLIEVQRNDESVQLTIPRGPIGISNGGRFRQ